MNVSFVTCDVFTERPFAGNPLLVVPDARGLTTAQMQAIAREINYSESTFVLPPDDPKHAYRQRTFVPVKEIPYAGHPTVGTAVVMAALGRVGGAAKGDGTTSITIEVGFGPLRLDLIRRSGVVGRVRMEQDRPEWGDAVTSPETLGRVAAALGVSFDALHPTLPAQPVSTGNRFLMLPLAEVAAVSGAVADTRLLNLVEQELTVLGVFFFASAGAGRFRARMFAPGAGVPEDPATGSAAGPLGVYLALHGGLPGLTDGHGRFFIDQGIEMGRPSEIEVEVLTAGPGRPTGVRVSGSAVLVMRGEISV
jgi:trans-2,3-dihydro-3-hydroxyanthranilate isomerase